MYDDKKLILSDEIQQEITEQAESANVSTLRDCSSDERVYCATQYGGQGG